MPRDPRGADQSQSNNQENEKPQAAPTNPDQTSTTQKDDEDFVDIHHEDVGMQDPNHQEPSPDGLGLQRLSAHGDEDDSSDDEPDHMASHPLLSMLTGRMGQRRRGSNHKWDALHPVTQVLSPANVEDCSKLEEEAFPEHERCTREKFEYRLSRCPELSLGLFSRPTEAQCQGRINPPQRRLIAHVVATRTPSPSVTDASMALPPDWKTKKSSLPENGEEEPQGHQDVGGTVCIHSMAVAKEHQKIGLGSILLKAYIQRIKDSKCAERLALLAHDHLIDFYTALGFENMGPSSAQFGGGEWHNLVMEFTNDDDE